MFSWNYQSNIPKYNFKVYKLQLNYTISHQVVHLMQRSWRTYLMIGTFLSGPCQIPITIIRRLLTLRHAAVSQLRTLDFWRLQIWTRNILKTILNARPGLSRCPSKNSNLSLRGVHGIPLGIWFVASTKQKKVKPASPSKDLARIHWSWRKIWRTKYSGI